MKSTFLFFFLIIISKLVISQTVVSYEYDASGNRESQVTTPIVLKSTSALQEEYNTPDSYSEQMDKLCIQIFPNPVKSELSVIIEGSESQSDINITVYDQGGKLILNLKNATENNLINLSDLTPGNYFMNIRVDNKVKQWKIVKE